MGRKGVSKRKIKAQKPQAASTPDTSGSVATLTKETEARPVAKGEAITSGKSGKGKSSDSGKNKKK